jgi:dihydropteroate synthase
MNQVLDDIVALDEKTALDDTLSQRFIELDPGGYFIIYVDHEASLICAKHYSNVINDKGLACDPETGEPFPCNKTLDRQATTLFTGRTAKELCIEIFEKPSPCLVTRLDHAAYLGREFVRAEIALLSQQEYVQD